MTYEEIAQNFLHELIFQVNLFFSFHQLRYLYSQQHRITNLFLPHFLNEKIPNLLIQDKFC